MQAGRRRLRRAAGRCRGAAGLGPGARRGLQRLHQLAARLLEELLEPEPRLRDHGHRAGGDVTPEVIRAVCTKELPGFGEQMRAASLRAGVPTAILSRQTAAILDRTLVVTLPGKPASIRVCLDAVFPAIPYCIDLIGGPRLDGNPAVVQVFRPATK